MDNLTPVGFSEVDLNGGFWYEKQTLNRDTTIYAVEDRFRDTGRFEAFKFNWKEGSDIPKPHYFWDSDIAKWLESAAYILKKNDVPQLYNAVSEVIDDIEAHQDKNGYFNIYHTVVEPDLRFKDRSHHELYCLGHLIEAAVAWYEATGEDRLIIILDRYISLVIKVFVEEKTSSFTVPGHEEIELALIKLYRLKKDKKYLDLAMFFLNKRGTVDSGHGTWGKTNYDQNHLPVRQQRTAEGHSVRACYLYSAMADAAKETDDEEMLEACKAIFDDIYYKKMYITGGIGSSHHGEAFTIPYDLPNDIAYAETCAAIALAFFANRMKDIDIDSKYADVVEKTIYNGILSGLSLDGKSFFYENPLEINLADRHRMTSVNENEHFPITQRVEVFGCSCCPPNLTRIIASLGNFFYSYSEDSIYIHQFASNDAFINGVNLNMETNYPSDGKIKINLAGAKGKKLCVRIPGWCRSFSASEEYKMKKGYAEFNVCNDIFDLEIEFEMRPVFMSAKSDVRFDAGKVALVYGPVVYCAEKVDNDHPLADYSVDILSEFESEFSDYFGVPVFSCDAYAVDTSDIKELYMFSDKVKKIKDKLHFIPYFSFANRGESDMRVWIRRA